MGNAALLTRLSSVNQKLNPLTRGQTKEDQQTKGRGSITQGTRNESGPLKLKCSRDFGRCSHCNILVHEVKNCDFKNTNAVPCGYCDEMYVAQVALEECKIDGLAACSSTENRSSTDIFPDSVGSSILLPSSSLRRTPSFPPIEFSKTIIVSVSVNLLD